MWYKECSKCDYYYKDETVEYCEVSLKELPESNCIGETEINEILNKKQENFNKEG